MNTEEKLDEGFLSNWLFKRNKAARKSYEDTFNVYKDSKLEDLAELYTISKMIDSIQGGALKIMCGDDIGYKLRSLKHNLGRAPSYEINQAKHIMKLVRTGGVIGKFEELCQGEVYDKYVAAGRSLTNFLGAYIEYEKNQGKDKEERTPEKEETIDPRPISNNERTFKTFIAINTILEKNGVKPEELSAYFDSSKGFDQPNNKITKLFTEVANAFGYEADDAYAFITGALINFYEDDFRATALNPNFFNYIKNAGFADEPLENGSQLLHKHVLRFFIVQYAQQLPDKPVKYKAYWQTFLARTSGMTKVPANVKLAKGEDATLVDAFDDIIKPAMGKDSNVDGMLRNIRAYINKYIEVEIEDKQPKNSASAD